MQRLMNFDVMDDIGNQFTLTCNQITYNGNVRGNGRAWYTLSGDVQQNGGPVYHAIYPHASWRMDNYPLSQVISITVNPLQNGDVDIYID